MNSRQGRAMSASKRFMDLDSPTYGDERERTVLTEASSFGLTIGIYVNLAVALVAAVLGELVLPLVLLVLTVVPASATSSYARRQNVNVEELASRAGLTTRLRSLTTAFLLVLLLTGAMAYTIFTGAGLITLPEVDVIGPDAQGILASMARGAVIGGLAGGVIGLFVIVIGQRRKARKASEAPEPLPDEEDE